MGDLVSMLREAAGVRSDGDAMLMAKAADELEQAQEVPNLIRWLNDIGATVTLELHPSHACVEIAYPNSVFAEHEDSHNWQHSLRKLAGKMADELDLTLPTKGKRSEALDELAEIDADYIEADANMRVRFTPTCTLSDEECSRQGCPCMGRESGKDKSDA